MPRESLERQLRQLQNEVLVMGSMVVKVINRTMDALKHRDLTQARQIIKDDQKINDKRFEIEESCTRLIATQQPMASDLRLIIAILNIITDLERIADYADGIAQITLMIGDEPPLKPLTNIPRMAEKGVEMLRGSLESLVEQDEERARRICAEDDEVDALYEQVFRELLTVMMEDPSTISRATRLIWVAHNLERIGDRVTNICERTVFIATGKMEEIAALK
ncbi:phosphate signaling complex protein PhoU [Dehalococcoidales bacterium]|nr:phosphate signaling complex protein PhoU [Dehalococcoidales bacterium]